MKILALEFSSHVRSVAIAERSHPSVQILASVEDANYRGTTGMSLIESAFKIAQIQPGDISLIVVGLGPGSYTGIRSSVAIAQGWQLGKGIGVAGLSSAACVAEEARRQALSGDVTVVIDAQRGDVYLQQYRLDRDSSFELGPLQILPATSIPADARLIGPEAEHFGPGGRNISPSAKTLAELAPERGTLAAESLEPIYLREATFAKAPPPRQIP